MSKAFYRSIFFVPKYNFLSEIAIILSSKKVRNSFSEWSCLTPNGLKNTVHIKENHHLGQSIQEWTK